MGTLSNAHGMYIATLCRSKLDEFVTGSYDRSIKVWRLQKSEDKIEIEEEKTTKKK
jgi:hypothetical protein